MANKTLFQSLRGALTRPTDAKNAAGAPAYAHAAPHALAQYAATGCLNGTFYADASAQLETILSLAAEVETSFLARTALYCRAEGHMKDTPAILLAVLATRDGPLFEQIFNRAIDNGRMLRTFVQVMRSGATGRKSLGSRPRRCVRRWIEGRSDNQLVRDGVGKTPSLADVIKMVHPSPPDASRSALYAWLVGQPHEAAELPASIRHYEQWKADIAAGRTDLTAPAVPFQMLTAQPLGRKAWTDIARTARWHMTRMNLNAFQRHGVFTPDDEGRTVLALVANRLRDPEAIRKARVFPYQLLAAWRNANPDLPAELKEALQDALEIATENVPALEGRIVICPDVSGSMSWAATGSRRGATSKVRCIDVAALITAALLRKNGRAQVLPFEHEVVPMQLNPRDSVLTNADRLSAVGGGGTSVSAPLKRVAESKVPVDAVILISDYESWCDAQGGNRAWHGTSAVRHWNRIVQKNPQAKLICLDLVPNGTTQAPEREDVLNIGGFSDQVFDLMANFVAGRMSPGHWMDTIDKIDL